MPKELRPILDTYLAGGMPANIALMRLCIEAGSPDEVRAAISEADGRLPGAFESPAGPLSRTAEGQGEGGALFGDGGTSPQPSPKCEREPGALPAPDPSPERLAVLSTLLDHHGTAWVTIREVMAEAEHDRTALSAEEAVEHWSAVFDRLAKAQPEAGVALYALGSPKLLEAATAEIVDALRGWDLINANKQVLEIGCGIGRFVRALAPEVSSVTGIDLSSVMIAEARKRCASLTNVRLEPSSGHDLAGFADASYDLVLAADVFPYLVGAGGELASRHIAEAARVLRPGGTLAILNYSYRGELEEDRRDIEDARASAGFTSLAEPRPVFRLWDGSVFLLRKAGA